MERLVVNKLGNLLVKELEGQYKSPCFSCDNINSCSIENGKTCGLYKVVEKVYEYEQLEEQGLLLRLQVKPGDTIYQPIGKDLNDYKVIGLCYNMAEKEWLYELAIQIGVDWFKTSCPMDCIGKTVFLTKEEAEQKLESMKGE